MHGAMAGAPKGVRNGNYRHGMNSKAFKEAIQAARLLSVMSQMMVQELISGD